MNRDDLRRQVIGQICAVMDEAEALGYDPVKYAGLKLPMIPEGVLWEAWVQFDNAKEERWWASLEKTIEGEIVRNALSGKGRAA